MMAPVKKAEIPLMRSTIPVVGNHGVAAPNTDSKKRAVAISCDMYSGCFLATLPVITEPTTMKSALRVNMTETDSGLPPVVSSRSTIVGATSPSFKP